MRWPMGFARFWAKEEVGNCYGLHFGQVHVYRVHVKLMQASCFLGFLMIHDRHTESSWCSQLPRSDSTLVEPHYG